jgi:phosphomannomutase
MTLIKSISGIRGTLGGAPGECLSPIDVVRFSSAFGTWLKKQQMSGPYRVMVGRDARPSGAMINSLVCSSLAGLGIDVTELGLASTPTVEIAVIMGKASGGIIISASHNPAEWNALKLLNSNGEFISASDGKEILHIAEEGTFSFVGVSSLGHIADGADFNKKHIDRILGLDLVDIKAIRRARLTVAVDAVNSVGGTILPALLRQLGVRKVIELYCEPNGLFPHNPEPLPEHLFALSDVVVQQKAHAGFAVDPDVDRLAIVCEDGSMFGEEYTLVAVADYVLEHKKGNTVSNLSSTRALMDVTLRHGGQYFASAVGEVNVVEAMKEHQAVIGGEGNGGVIYPPLHYGRDALVGIALFLSQLARLKMSTSELRRKYPSYSIAKTKMDLPHDLDMDQLLEKLAREFASYPCNKTDGLRIDFPGEWVHIRKSNTEPILRIYAESGDPSSSRVLASRIVDQIRQISGK